MSNSATERRPTPGTPQPRAAASTPPDRAPGQDALGRAKSCLGSAQRRLKKRDAVEQTDEVLTLLRAATIHLRHALPAASESRLHTGE